MSASEDVRELRQAYGDIADFARAYNPCVQHRLMTAKARKGVVALAGNVPTLSLLSEAYPAAAADMPLPAALWVKLQLEDFFEYCEQQVGVTSDRVYELSLIIVERYHFLNVLEIELWLAECKGSATFFGTAGPLRMMELLKNYVVERNADIARVESEIKAIERSMRRQRAEDYKRYYEEYNEKRKEEKHGK